MEGRKTQHLIASKAIKILNPNQDLNKGSHFQFNLTRELIAFVSAISLTALMFNIIAVFYYFLPN